MRTLETHPVPRRSIAGRLPSSRLAAVALFVGAAGCADSGGDSESDPVREESAALCEKPDARDVNAAADRAIAAFGADGEACRDEGRRRVCLSYSARRPAAVAVGDDHANATSAFECEDAGSGLSACIAADPQAFDCAFGGDCTCAGGIIAFDCLMMAPYCKNGTFACDVDSCWCEYFDGC